jgi:hypothetical protein
MGAIWLHEFYTIQLFPNDEFNLCFEVGSVVYLFLEKPLRPHFHNFILSLFFVFFLPKICMGVSVATLCVTD